MLLLFFKKRKPTKKSKLQSLGLVVTATNDITLILKSTKFLEFLPRFSTHKAFKSQFKQKVWTESRLPVSPFLLTLEIKMLVWDPQAHETSLKRARN